MRSNKNEASGTALLGAPILIVEDDTLLLMELESILQDAGAKIMGRCRNVSEALKALEQNQVAAAVLDVRIGNKTIAPVARSLAKQGTPFLFYTGQVENDPALAEWTGYIVLSKPAKAAAIVDAVARLLALKESSVAR
jgi:DNA-binding LytR/AlgR family response regulator